MRRLYKFISDFIFLSFKFGVIEGWEDAKFINNKDINKQLKYYQDKLKIKQHEKGN